jgi:hypothetical protein
MAKKASSNTTTTRIPLPEARALVIRAYEAAQLAERLLVEWLGEGRVRWSCKRLEGPHVSDLAALAARKREAAAVGLFFFDAYAAYSEGDPAFWRTGLEINWEEGWASEMYVVGGTSAYGIRVVREDVLALLPEQPGEHEEASASATSKWITEEARRMNRAGKIPTKITAFANELEQRMGEAVRAGTVKKAVGWRYIKNKLPAWGLWPISSIK